MTTGVKRLHHAAYRCRDAEETRRFYEDVLGFPLAHVVTADVVPSVGDDCPYVHIFFRLDDGEYIAFFDIGGDKATAKDPETPEWVNHIAFEVADEDELSRWKAKLESHGIEVVGVTDHHFVHSIYFFDPNGIRLELTHPQESTAGYMVEKRASARRELDEWTADKATGFKARKLRLASLAVPA